MENHILHIDTASANGLVMLSRAGIPVAVRTNAKATEHAAFVQPAIKELMEETGIIHSDISCIAVANGPGSYTGLRVGLAAAKGLCYAWNIPLLTLSSLHLMAAAMQDTMLSSNETISPDALFAPMIDARRMEVFRAVYIHPQLKAVIEPGAEIINPAFLGSLLEVHQVIFSGDGAAKWQNICQNPNAFFRDQPPIEKAFAKLALYYGKKNDWANLAYSEPFYTKAFQNISKSRYNS